MMRLPGHSRGTWRRSGTFICRRYPREPDFENLADYVDDEANLVSNPLFSKQAFSRYVHKRVVLVIIRQQFRHAS